MNLTGLRHQEQQRKRVVSLLAAFACQVADRFLSKSGSSQRLANLAATLRGTFAQRACKRGGAIGLQSIKRKRGGVAHAHLLIIKRTADATKSIITAKRRNLSQGCFAFAGLHA